MLTLNPHQARLLSVVMLILGIAFPYIGLGNDMLGRDEAYQALCVMNYSDSPLAMLTFYIGNLWIGLFGNEIIWLRRLMVLCYQVSIAISCIYLYYRTRRLMLVSTLFLTMCLGVRYVAMSLYGWDAGAYPFMTIFMVALLIYATSPSLGKIIFVGCTAGFMVMSRVPTLAALPFILVAIIYVRRGADGSCDVRTVLSDSLVGLMLFAVTVLLVILLMTSGNIDNYISAWTSDNIINGHFDKDMLIWRWKDVARRTVTAFYPMMLCFAGACYMLRVQRHYRLNLLLTALVCTVLSFYFLKTYNLYLEYAAGIYESFFLLIIFLPWLYNMTHKIPVSVSVFPLVVIAFCSILAGIGSDGFLERPMTVNTIPLLCIFIYDKFRGVMRYFLSFALLSAFAMFAFLVVSEAKGLEYDFSDKQHMAGIKTKARGGNVVERFMQVSPVIESLKSRGIDCSIVGTDRYEFDYVFNNAVSYNLHHFHYFDREDDIMLLQGVMNKFDWILVIYSADSANYPETETYLYNHGYDLADQDAYFRLFRRVAQPVVVNN